MEIVLYWRPPYSHASMATEPTYIYKHFTTCIVQCVQDKTSAQLTYRLPDAAA
jgi:hypothetical protein